ncbi:hypothetical protein B0H11DRAFT_1935428 [Mycena galericulata]|nr:hypothetical protein B0H11DRAFT_1935428 [Mycena galericulata]
MPLREKYKHLKQVLRPQCRGRQDKTITHVFNGQNNYRLGVRGRRTCITVSMRVYAAGKTRMATGAAHRGIMGGAYLGYKNSCGCDDEPLERAHGRQQAADALPDERQTSVGALYPPGTLFSLLALSNEEREKAEGHQHRDKFTEFRLVPGISLSSCGSLHGYTESQRRACSKAADLAAIKLPDLGVHVEAETPWPVTGPRQCNGKLMASPCTPDWVITAKDLSPMDNRIFNFNPQLKFHTGIDLINFKSGKVFWTIHVEL